MTRRDRQPGDLKIGDDGGGRCAGVGELWCRGGARGPSRELIGGHGGEGGAASPHPSHVRPCFVSVSVEDAAPNLQW